MQSWTTRFGQCRVHDNEPIKMLGLVERKAEQPEAERTNILRWEDDGGYAIECTDRADRFAPELAKRNNQQVAASATKALE